MFTALMAFTKAAPTSLPSQSDILGAWFSADYTASPSPRLPNRYGSMADMELLTMAMSSGVVNGAGGTHGQVASSANSTLAAGTVMALALPPTSQSYSMVCADKDDYNVFAFGENDGTYGAKFFGFGGVSSPTNTLGKYLGQGLNYTVLGSRFSSTYSDVIAGKSTVWIGGGRSSITGLKNLWVNDISGTLPGNYKIVALVFWGKSLSNSEYTQAYNCLATAGATAGVSVSSCDKYCAFDGDSITHGQSVLYGGYPDRAKNLALFSPVCFGVNVAVSGSTITDLADRLPSLTNTLAIMQGGGKSKYICMIGRNALSGDVPTFLADYQTHLTNVRAAGFQDIGICTILPSTATGFNAKRNTANTTIRTWAGTYCDFVVDMAADSTMGIDGDGSTTGPWNATYFPDGTHPSDAGQAILAGILATAVNTRW